MSRFKCNINILRNIDGPKGYILKYDAHRLCIDDWVDDDLETLFNMGMLTDSGFLGDGFLKCLKTVER